MACLNASKSHRYEHDQSDASSRFPLLETSNGVSLKAEIPVNPAVDPLDRSALIAKNLPKSPRCVPAYPPAGGTWRGSHPRASVPIPEKLL
jgi:hypothetical protein